MFLAVLAAQAQPVRGAAGDLWADRILGQFDFSEIKFNEANAYNLFNPTSVFVDIPHNLLYLWDSGNNRLLAVHNLSSAANNQGADMVLGQPDFIHTSCNGDSNWQSFNWTASPTGFYSPQVLPNPSCFCGASYFSQSPAEAQSSANMATDSQGDLYVPDYANNRVLRFDYPLSTHQAASHVWGQLDGAGTEQFTYQAANNNGSNAIGTPDSQNLYFFYFPFGDDGVQQEYGAGVAVDKWDNLWVADVANNRVLRFPNTGGPGGVPSHTADVVLGQANFSGNGANTNVNNLSSFPVLNEPMAVRVDVSGNVYVAEANNSYGRVSIFQPTGVDGSGVPVYGSNAASQKIVASGSTGPEGIEIDPNMDSATQVGLWVVDHLAFKAFRYQVTWPAFSVTTTQTINTPECLASPGIDGSGNLYISNYRGMSLPRYPAGSGSPDISIFQAPAGSNGTQNKIGDTGFYVPSGVIVASPPSSGVTQVIVGDGVRLHFWNMPVSGPLGLTNGQAEDGYAGTSQPYVFNSSFTAGFGEMATDSTGQNLWVLEATNPTRVDLFSLPLPSVAETTPVLTLTSPLSVLGKSVQVSWNSLTGLAADPNGDLWISDAYDNRVMRVRNPTTSPVVDVVLGQTDPGAGAIGGNCNGTGTGASCSNPNPTASTLYYPGRLKFDHHGDLYVSDHWLEFNGNFRLLRFDAKSLPATTVSTCQFAIPADGVYGTGGSFTSVAAAPYDRAFWEPAFNSSDTVMVAGTNSQVSGGYPPVILQNPRNGINPAGTPDIPGAGDNPSGHLMDYGPQSFALTFDSQDNLYVTELNRSRVLIYAQPFVVFTPTSTMTSTATLTVTPTASPTATPTGTWYTSTPLPTSTPTDSPTVTPTPTPSPSATPTPVSSPCCVLAWSQPGGTLATARGIAIDDGRNMGYVADGNSIRSINLSTGALTGTVGAAGAWGSSQGLNMGADGDLYVANYSLGTIQKVDPTSGTVLATIGASDGLGNVRDVFVDSNGDLYVSSLNNTNNLYRYVYTAPNSYAKVVLSLSVTLNTPTGVGRAGNNLFVADSLNNRVVMLKETVTGSNNYDQATVLTGNSIGLNVPQELAVDLAGNICVADYNSGAFVVWGPTGNFLFNCQKPAYGSPFGIGVDTQGNLYLGDAAGNDVVKVNGGCLTEPPYGTLTPTATFTSTTTSIPTFTPSPTATWTATGTNSPTGTPTSTFSATLTRTLSPTSTPTSTATISPTSTPSLTPTEPCQDPLIYPNPAKGVDSIQLHLSPCDQGQSCELKIFTVAFRKVLDKVVSPTPVGMDLTLELKDDGGTPLANGLYYLVLTDGERRTVGRLLVLR